MAVFLLLNESRWTQRIHITSRSSVKGSTTAQYIQKSELTDSFDVVGSVEKNGPMANTVCGRHCELMCLIGVTTVGRVPSIRLYAFELNYRGFRDITIRVV